MTDLRSRTRPAQVRRLVTAIPGPRSLALHARRTTAVAQGVSSVLPIYVAEAGGGVVVDVDGNSLIDLASGIAVTNVGNAAPAVVAGVRDQVIKFSHTCFMVAPYELYVAVCEQLNRLTPGDHEKRTALFNSGAEAVENLVKIARHYTGRPAVVVFDHAYHGRTNLTMALTAKNLPYKQGFGPFAPEIYRVPGSYPFRDGSLDGAAAAARAIDLIERQVGADNVACVLIEPIQGEGGFIVPARGFLPTLASYCADRGIVFGVDEVQTGFARTGDWFACHHEGVVPDLIATAKGIAGGLPLAAVTGRVEIMNACRPGSLGGTYGGNPVACAAALGVIATIERHNLVERARQMGNQLIQRLSAIAQRHAAIGEVRGRGAMIAVEIVRRGTNEPDPETTAAVANGCHRRGVLVLTAGTFSNVLRFLPPLVISDELLSEGMDVLAEAFAEATGQQ